MHTLKVCFPIICWTFLAAVMFADAVEAVDSSRVGRCGIQMGSDVCSNVDVTGGSINIDVDTLLELDITH